MQESSTKENKKAKKSNKKMLAKKGLKDAKDEKIHLEDEIVIGLNLVDDKNIKVTDKKKRAKQSKKNAQKTVKKSKKENKNMQTQKQKEIKKRKQTPSRKISPKQYEELQKRRENFKRRATQVLEALLLLSILVGIILFATLSPVFDIASIEVSGNSILTSATVESLSGIIKGENLFRFSTKTAKENIKSNPYVQDVTIKRAIPNTIKIEVNERVPSFLIEYADSYVYMNNQGYFLEIAREKKELPILIGYRTQQEELEPGKRMCREDLKKLGDVLEIVANSKQYGLYEKITKIDMTEENNYKLILEEEQKTVHLGPITSLTTKMPHIQMILERTQGIPGDYYLNIDLNQQDPYFREKV